VETRLGCFFVPVLGRQGYTPNILRLIQFNTVLQRVSRIDVDNASIGTLARQVDVDRNSHPKSQVKRGQNQRPMQVHHNGLTITREAPIATFHCDCHPERNTRTSP